MTRVLWVEDDSAVRLVGTSERWVRALEELRRLAEQARAPLLIAGEPGTGKELCARLWHAASPHAGGPFVAVNVARLPAERLRQELFGEQARADGAAARADSDSAATRPDGDGAATRPDGDAAAARSDGDAAAARSDGDAAAARSDGDGAAARPGLFDLAHGGTLLLDEIGSLPPDLQPWLLGVLDGQQASGGAGTRRADVRVVAATSRDLLALVAARAFMDELHRRISALTIALPPLRERAGDVHLLAAHFLERLSGAAGLSAAGFSPRALTQLEAYPWPGNVRELRSVIERALLVADGATVDVQHLPPEIGVFSAGLAAQRMPPPARGSASLGEAVRRHILTVYAAHGGNVTRTATALGITRVSLRRHLRQYLTGDASSKERLSD
jgi:DNA-binding NtrC family response regulator